MIGQWLPSNDNIMDVSTVFAAMATAIVYRKEVAEYLNRPLKEKMRLLDQEAVGKFTKAMLTWFFFLLLFLVTISSVKMLSEKPVGQY